MMSVGSAVGHLFHWGAMNSLFLGGMLAMSSTTIIYKAFDDLGLRQKSLPAKYSACSFSKTYSAFCSWWCSVRWL